MQDVVVTETTKPKRVRTPKTDVPPPPPVVVAPVEMNYVSLIFHQAKDGSRIGFILVGPEPHKWLAAQQKARVNVQKWVMPADNTSLVAATETESFTSELTRHKLWGYQTYATEVQLGPDSTLLERKYRAVATANQSRIYLTGTLEISL